MEWVAAAGGIVGLVGGVAGLWTFAVQERTRRRKMRYPGELRAALMTANSLIFEMTDTDGADRSARWYIEHVNPAARRLCELLAFISDERVFGDVLFIGERMFKLTMAAEKREDPSLTRWYAVPEDAVGDVRHGLHTVIARVLKRTRSVGSA